ncbi:hypothetical protein V496_07549 [Pseudogymnoascus sp. VKM F-4515 (FW-2607)]|nr:hypothetical protein V496_07549 [Pseudogymnoascus sp. VKM F-4515 (FW-2607)]
MSVRLSHLRGILPKPRAAPHSSAVGCSPVAAAVVASAAHRRYFSRLHAKLPATDIVKALKDEGCVVIESMFTPAQIARLNVDMDAALSPVTTGRPANANTPPLAEGVDAMVFGQNTRRVGGLPGKSSAFREDVCDNDSLHSVSTELFKETGDYWLSTAQMIEIGPGSKAQPLHADASGWWPFWAMGDRWQPEFAVNFLIATTDTTKANGATGVVRGSHHTVNPSDLFDDPTLSAWQFPDEKVEQIELKAGDCLLLGGKIVHRGEENKTADEYRRLLSCTVISASLTPEEAHPISVEGEKAKDMTERAKKFIGFRELTTTIGPHVWQDHRQGGLKKALGF